MDTGSLRDNATPQQEPRLWPRGLPSVHWDVQRASDEHTQRSGPRPHGLGELSPRHASADDTLSSRSASQPSVPAPAPKAGLWTRPRSPTSPQPSEAGGTKRGVGTLCTPTPQRMEGALRSCRRVHRVTGAPAWHQPRLEAVSSYARPQPPRPGLPGSLAKPLLGGRAVPRGPQRPGLLATLLQQARRPGGSEAGGGSALPQWGRGLSHRPALVPRQRGRRDPGREGRAAGPLWPHLFLKSPQ